MRKIYELIAPVEERRALCNINKNKSYAFTRES